MCAAFDRVAWAGPAEDHDTAWRALAGNEGTKTQMRGAPGRRKSKFKGPHVGGCWAC